jgi:hypothetical protein
MKNLFFLVLFVVLGIYYNNVSNNLIPYTAEPLFQATSEQEVALVFSYDLYIDEETKKKIERKYSTNRSLERSVESYKEYVKDRYSEKEYKCYDKLIFKESSWNPDAKNPKSTAYGLGQFLDKTWDLVPQSKTNDPYEQLDAMFIYVDKRYGSSCKAWDFWLKKNWY